MEDSYFVAILCVALICLDTHSDISWCAYHYLLSVDEMNPASPRMLTAKGERCLRCGTYGNASKRKRRTINTTQMTKTGGRYRKTTDDQTPFTQQCKGYITETEGDSTDTSLKIQIGGWNNEVTKRNGHLANHTGHAR